MRQSRRKRLVRRIEGANEIWKVEFSFFNQIQSSIIEVFVPFGEQCISEEGSGP
jgi:hypothetical protein